MGANAFKAKALPLHVNITHTPPVLAEGAVQVQLNDPGFIGSATLTPTSFNTGSYGWKGSKRVTIEVENHETGEKEKVHVMMTCVYLLSGGLVALTRLHRFNATVVGSKNAPDDEGTAAEQPEAHAEEQPEQEAKTEKTEVSQETAAQETSAEAVAETVLGSAEEAGEHAEEKSEEKVEEKTATEETTQ